MGVYDDLKKELAHDLYYNLGTDDDHRCPDCGLSLEYIVDDGVGYWKCTNCDFIMCEDEVFATDPGEYDPDKDIDRDNSIL